PCTAGRLPDGKRVARITPSEYGAVTRKLLVLVPEERSAATQLIYHLRRHIVPHHAAGVRMQRDRDRPKILTCARRELDAGPRQLSSGAFNNQTAADPRLHEISGHTGVQLHSCACDSVAAGARAAIGTKRGAEKPAR